MPQEIISKKTKDNLEILIREGILKSFYLADGTGVALQQLKHRVSLDLDFFTKKDVDAKILIQKIKTWGKLSIERETENTLIGIFNGTRVSFLKYDYPLLFDLKQIEGIRVADAKNNPMPKMIVPVSWQEIKNFFQQEIRKIINK